MGGLAILLGLSVGIFVAIPFVNGDLVSLFAAFLTIMLTGIVGICDDMFGIRQKTKALLPLFASIPLIAVQAGEHFMIVPFVGLVDFGLIYPLVFIPIGITVLANASNMLAGYNGLEAGLGFITCGFIGIAGLMAGRPLVFVIMFATAAACLGFLKYNRLPSRIFPGDVGTFLVGSAIASAVVVGNMEFVGIIACMPYLINGAITGFGVIRGMPIQKFSKVENGFLVPPEKGHVSALYFGLERAFRLTEKKLVRIMWLIAAVFGLLSLAVVIIT
jgi:UDP-N-acetylglucosamine--dolichyl-phosphate N-acetylglucosaminephosphotransferase